MRVLRHNSAPCVMQGHSRASHKTFAKVTEVSISKAKKELNWAELGFQYRQTDFRFSATYSDGAWSTGELLESPLIAVHEGAPALHYAQQCFEGMKA